MQADTPETQTPRSPRLRLARETLRRLAGPQADGDEGEPTTATDHNGDCPHVPDLAGDDPAPLPPPPDVPAPMPDDGGA
jgi:hypothetical protein